MKAFFIGVLGALITLITVTSIMSQYSDYTQRVKTDVILFDLEVQQKEIEKSLLAKTPIEEKTSSNTTRHIQLIKIQNNGVIVVKATDEGQMLILTPTIKDNAVIWSCMGSPNIWIPQKCRH